MKEQIKQAMEKVTPGPWIKATDKFFNNTKAVSTENGYGVAYGVKIEDCHLIANAPTWLRWQNERIEELEKALTIVRDTLAHRKDDSRTDWYLWNEADKVLKGVSHDT